MRSGDKDLCTRRIDALARWLLINPAAPWPWEMPNPEHVARLWASQIATFLDDFSDGELERLRSRVEELTALLNDPDRLFERLRQLRQIEAAADADDYRDRLAAGGDV